ncbi:beta-eliminating lyase-related protein [Paracoccus sp. 1_MG-2023]|uniref:threonine aldolase family protein n=1 Tax=unclassified Paracoccus (in: a-proteobacteria) TaxID=2688777 RepID=UPI001C0993BE|nr:MULTISPECIES: beta-eliminating lyase-related protein [unclassified Paracoccus (in: a-proteobacteria)]MBU2956746.1 low specificity L-threonine aldolase [Paracoccus sp. C2R09]MDO6669215.1 beta-eliminating lyase-related protein [Paracoccus sp. 1_MG-2023]
MNFASDNVRSAHPAVFRAMERANAGAASPYGGDDVTAEAVEAIRDLFEAPEAVVRFAATGTAANALVCAQLSPSFGRIYCHADAHIETSECAAPEFFSHGAKLVTLPGPDGKLDPEILQIALQQGAAGGLNEGRSAMVSITNATEWGTVYDLSEVRALADATHAMGLPFHMDGARFANAAAHLGASPADLTWRAGVDALCFGGTKNGAMAAEAMIFFQPSLAGGFDYRRKQSGHVFSKNRFLAAQMLALATDGLWRDLAGAANAKARILADAVIAGGGRLLTPVQSNAVFAEISAATHEHATRAGAEYYPWPDKTAAGVDPISIRLVCAWDTPDEDVAALAAILRG